MMEGLDNNSPWSLIDAVPVVNLDQRPERWARFMENAKGMIPEEKLVRFSASHGVSVVGYGEKPWFRGNSKDSRWGAKAGCTLSHQRLMEAAVENGWETILVLEDDADFSNTNAEELAMVIRQVMSQRNDWDVCYLGFSKTRGPSRKVGKLGDRVLYSISGAATTHAYIVNAKARDWARLKLPTLENLWEWTAEHRVVDRWYSWNMTIDLRVFAVSPSIITQMEGFSDIVGSNVDYDDEFPGRVIDERSGISYCLRRVLWRLQRYCTLVQDRFRFFIKRIKGF